MALKSAAENRSTITDDRAGRLYRLVQLLSKGRMNRASLLKKLKVGVRTFYRDVDLLRGCGVSLETAEDGYELKDDVEKALFKIPFPDPELSFGDVMNLVKGKGPSQTRLREAFHRVTQ